MAEEYDNLPSGSRFVGHRGHIIMLPAGWVIMEIANKGVPIVAICGQALGSTPIEDRDACVNCHQVSKLIHGQWCDVPAECRDVAADEGPQRPPYAERAQDQWGLRYDASKFILMTRNCDEDGLNWEEKEQPWSDVAVFSYEHQADRAIKALRSSNGLQ